MEAEESGTMPLKGLSSERHLVTTPQLAGISPGGLQPVGNIEEDHPDLRGDEVPHPVLLRLRSSRLLFLLRHFPQQQTVQPGEVVHADDVKTVNGKEGGVPPPSGEDVAARPRQLQEAHGARGLQELEGGLGLQRLGQVLRELLQTLHLREDGGGVDLEVERHSSGQLRVRRAFVPEAGERNDSATFRRRHNSTDEEEVSEGEAASLEHDLSGLLQTLTGQNQKFDRHIISDPTVHRPPQTRVHRPESTDPHSPQTPQSTDPTVHRPHRPESTDHSPQTPTDQSPQTRVQTDRKYNQHCVVLAAFNMD
ncbi:hypothetical protein EYF80_053219 [Liparis tanakae]|uniref:Uncharacterized protein n=1 Tax=Liparis tanakae TaxID=230148 RepID=A0A4Z2F693_9TELE|nr:hypothetical protein EYF80_053219 [Liparis tanakae]